LDIYYIRHNVFITIIMEGKIAGKRTRGRPRKSFFEEIFRRMGCTSYQSLKRMACDRHDWLRQQVLALRSWWWSSMYIFFQFKFSFTYVAVPYALWCIALAAVYPLIKSLFSSILLCHLYLCVSWMSNMSISCSNRSFSSISVLALLTHFMFVRAMLVKSLVVEPLEPRRAILIFCRCCLRLAGDAERHSPLTGSPHTLVD